MTTVSIHPSAPDAAPRKYRAVAGRLQAVGATMGGALDALALQLKQDQSAATLVIVQPGEPDPYFTAEQQDRLQELMTRWRAARDSQCPLSPEEEAELQALAEAEVQGAAARTAALLRGLQP